MEDGTYRYRFSSPRSAGHLQSFKLQLRYPRQPLILAQLIIEFELHRFLNYTSPTALVSTTKDLVRALKGAYDTHYKNGEDVKDVYLTIINIPGLGSERPDPHLRVHSAVQLARVMGLDEKNQRLFKDEYLFELYMIEDFRWNHTGLMRGANELRKRIYKADARKDPLSPCFRCAVHICADGRDLRLDPEVYVREGCWNPWLPEKLGRDCGQFYRWDTACLSKVHVNREPSRQLRIAIMAISKRKINEAYDVTTDNLGSKLQQAMSKNDKHLCAIIREELEEMETWLNEEINRVCQTHEMFIVQ